MRSSASRSRRHHLDTALAWPARSPRCSRRSSNLCGGGRMMPHVWWLPDRGREHEAGRGPLQSDEGRRNGSSASAEGT
jgi:hypothetical protein